MTAADRINRLVPYVTRLLEDDDVQDQLGKVVTGGRRAGRVALISLAAGAALVYRLVVSDRSESRRA